ncbi:MAG: hypothetical protein V3V15_11470 [Sphingorhabdus sp.]
MTRISHSFIALVAACAMLPAATSAQEIAENGDIVVTGRSLADTEAALKACLDRSCPPDEDIRATLAHAENQFVEGDYKDARGTLLSSLGRNRKHKGGYPVDVSNLLRANANVAEHLGEADSYRLSVLGLRDVLKKGLPEDDFRVLAAELEVADSRQKLGYPDEARRKYEDIEKLALKHGIPRLAAMARVRYLSSLVLRAQSAKTTFNRRRAAKALDAYIAEPTKGAEVYGYVAEILKSRLDRSFGVGDSTEALIKRFTELGGSKRPVLLAANPIEQDQAALTRSLAGGSDLNRMTLENVENRWVDIGFWINPDGKIDDMEVLRSKGTVNWVKPVLKSIRSRIYTPINDKESPGFYAVERYSLTANWTKFNTGTRMRKRSPILSIKKLDLSNDNQ